MADSADQEYLMYRASTDTLTSKPVRVMVQVIQADLLMEADTGATFPGCNVVLVN